MGTALGLAKRNNGFISAADAAAQGIPRRALSSAAEHGELVRLERGLYCLPETWADEYVIAQHRFARGIFSHDSALYLLGLSDDAPEALTMSFPRGYNISGAKGAGILTKTSPKGLHGLGEAAAMTPYGNMVKAYDAERTLCDMLRGTASPDLQLENPAIRSYLSGADRNIPKLMSYADSLGVGRKIRRYLEVLL